MRLVLDCEECQGDGQVDCYMCMGDGEECFECESTGWQSCSECGGLGFIQTDTWILPEINVVHFNNKFEEFIHLQAKQYDKEIPNWYQQIHDLDMSNENRCILGQLDLWGYQVRVTGFDIPNHKFPMTHYDYLKLLWEKEIELRTLEVRLR